MCDKPKTSGEHVPPKCLFPENKDLESGENFRKNLIKVPSCDEHNSAKSQDDEFMLITFASSMAAEKGSGSLQNSKLKRILDRKPHVFNELLKYSTPVKLPDNENNIVETCIFSLDRERFMNQMEAVANGVYFHHLKQKVTGRTIVNPIKGFQTTSIKQNLHNAETKKFAETLFPAKPVYGDNPDIFYYQVTEDKPEMIMKLVFYRNIEFIAVFNGECR